MDEPPLLIALTGHACTGKTELAAIMARDYAIPTVSILEEVQSVLLGIDPMVGLNLPLSVLLSDLGGEWGMVLASRLHGQEVQSLLDRLEAQVRTVAGPDVWVRAAVRTAREQSRPASGGTSVLCLDGVGNEADIRWVRSSGGLVWGVMRSGEEESSRFPVRESLVDAVVVNTATRTHMRDQVAPLLEDMGVRRRPPLEPAGPVQSPRRSTPTSAPCTPSRPSV